MKTCKCGEGIPEKRLAHGYFTCLDCGDRNARQEIERKAMRVVPMHKSNYVYIGSGEQAKETVNAISTMRRT